jgi:hypothetical protein
MGNEQGIETGRRGFLGTAGSLAAVPFLGVAQSQASARAAGSAAAAAPAPGRRKLGTLEVSSVGLGVTPAVAKLADSYGRHLARVSSLKGEPT